MSDKELDILILENQMSKRSQRNFLSIYDINVFSEPLQLFCIFQNYLFIIDLELNTFKGYYHILYFTKSIC